MASRPEDKARWANIDVVDPVTNVQNVINPPDSAKNIGFRPFNVMIRSYVNWLFKTNYDWQEYFDARFERDVITDGNGVEVVAEDDCLVEVFAVDTTTPANYIKAVGYKANGSATVLNVISSNVLTIDSTDTDGTIVIAGANAEDIKMRVQFNKSINQL